MYLLVDKQIRISRKPLGLSQEESALDLEHFGRP